MDVVIRRMQREDLDATLDLFAEVAAEGLWLGTEAGFDRADRRARWEADLEAADSVTLVVMQRDGGRILGHGRVQREAFGVAEVGMSLAAPARGVGVGGRLMDALLEAAGQLGAHKVDLQVWPHNVPAIRLYLSRGFVVEGRLHRHYPRSNGELWDAILMGLELSASKHAQRPGSRLPDAEVLPRTMTIRS